MAENNENMSTEGAGNKGGDKAAQERGPEFYSETGRKGGHSQGKDKDPGNTSNLREDADQGSEE